MHKSSQGGSASESHRESSGRDRAAGGLTGAGEASFGVFHGYRAEMWKAGSCLVVRATVRKYGYARNGSTVHLK